MINKLFFSLLHSLSRSLSCSLRIPLVKRVFQRFQYSVFVVFCGVGQSAAEPLTLYKNNPDNVGVIYQAAQNITIDGVNNEPDWARALWRPINQHIVGTIPEETDFSGQFKLLWDEQYLYVLAAITDDILFDQHADPLKKYWDDDCLEIFIDEDNSGGDHQFNFNAFAYHIALDNQAVDIGAKEHDDTAPFILLNDHINSVWRRDNSQPHRIIWEVAVKLFDDSYAHGERNNSPVLLKQGKEIGFMLAYCDNDGSQDREHFLGSFPILPLNGDKNLGYKTADVFQTFMLK